MLIFRQTVNNDDVVGPGTREVVLKRFFFRMQGRLYVYTSSLPDQILNSSDEEIKEDDADKLVIVFRL